MDSLGQSIDDTFVLALFSFEARTKCIDEGSAHLSSDDLLHRLNLIACSRFVRVVWPRHYVHWFRWSDDQHGHRLVQRYLHEGDCRSKQHEEGLMEDSLSGKEDLRCRSVHWNPAEKKKRRLLKNEMKVETSIYLVFRIRSPNEYFDYGWTRDDDEPYRGEMFHILDE